LEKSEPKEEESLIELVSDDEGSSIESDGTPMKEKYSHMVRSNPKIVENTYFTQQTTKSKHEYKRHLPLPLPYKHLMTLFE